MNIGVLGAGGFIGSHVVEHLLRKMDVEIVGLDVHDAKLPDDLGPGFTFHRVDLRQDRDVVESIVREADVVLDLIAYANPSIYVSSPLEVVELNYTENCRVVEMCARHDTHLVQFSTAEVYGFPDGPDYSEDRSRLSLGPVDKQRWIYAAAKQLLERVVHAHGLDGSLTYTIVRPFNFVGPRFDYLVPSGSVGGPRVFAHFMSALLTGGPMYLVDGGERRRCFTHIDDAMSAIELLIDHPAATNAIFNIGNPAAESTIRGVAELMCELYEELTGKPARNELVMIDGDAFYGKGYQDVDRVPPNIDKIRSLGWEPQCDLRSIFRDAMRSYLGDGALLGS